MSNIAKYAGFLMIWLSPLGLFAQNTDDKQLVLNAFQQYKSAVLSNNGKEAAKHVDSKTIKYFGNILLWITTADSIRLENLSLYDKFMVLSARQRIPLKLLQTFSDSSFFSYIIDKRMLIAGRSIADEEPGDIEIGEGMAEARLIKGNEPLPFFIPFYKEGGQWKIDITAFFPVHSSGFRKLAKDRKMSENEYIFRSLEAETGKRPARKIWQPLH